MCYNIARFQGNPELQLVYKQWRYHGNPENKIEYQKKSELQNHLQPTGHQPPKFDCQLTNSFSTDPSTTNHWPSNRSSNNPPVTNSWPPTYWQVLHRPTNHKHRNHWQALKRPTNHRPTNHRLNKTQNISKQLQSL